MNLPNRLTLLRIFLIPVFILFSVGLPDVISKAISFIGLGNSINMFTNFVERWGLFAAGIVFLIAFSTDALDGYIARKNNLVTDFGIFMDPIADKLLVTSALVVLASRGVIGAWIPIIIISRELIITSLRLLASNKGIVLAAGGFGKAKTILQSVALTLLLFGNFSIAPLNAINAGGLILYAALLFTILSGVDYIIKNRSLFLNN